jgi:hypothetical protein
MIYKDNPNLVKNVKITEIKYVTVLDNYTERVSSVEGNVFYSIYLDL